MPGQRAAVDHAGDSQGGGERFRGPGHLVQQAGQIPGAPLVDVEFEPRAGAREAEVGGAVQQPRHLRPA